MENNRHRINPNMKNFLAGMIFTLKVLQNQEEMSSCENSALNIINGHNRIKWYLHKITNDFHHSTVAHYSSLLNLSSLLLDKEPKQASSIDKSTQTNEHQQPFPKSLNTESTETHNYVLQESSVYNLQDSVINDIHELNQTPEIEQPYSNSLNNLAIETSHFSNSKSFSNDEVIIDSEEDADKDTDLNEMDLDLVISPEDEEFIENRLNSVSEKISGLNCDKKLEDSKIEPSKLISGICSTDENICEKNNENELPVTTTEHSIPNPPLISGIDILKKAYDTNDEENSSPKMSPGIKSFTVEDEVRPFNSSRNRAKSTTIPVFCRKRPPMPLMQCDVKRMATEIIPRNFPIRSIRSQNVADVSWRHKLPPSAPYENRRARPDYSNNFDFRPQTIHSWIQNKKNNPFIPRNMAPTISGPVAQNGGSIPDTRFPPIRFKINVMVFEGGDEKCYSTSCVYDSNFQFSVIATKKIYQLSSVHLSSTNTLRMKSPWGSKELFLNKQGLFVIEQANVRIERKVYCTPEAPAAFVYLGRDFSSNIGFINYQTKKLRLKSSKTNNFVVLDFDFHVGLITVT